MKSISRINGNELRKKSGRIVMGRSKEIKDIAEAFSSWGKESIDQTMIG